MKNLSFKNNLLPIFFLLLISVLNHSCKKEDCTELKEPLYFGHYGASALINGEYWEANATQFSYSQDGAISISLNHNIWYENTVWANRSSIVILNLQPVVSEFLDLQYQPVGQIPRPTATVHTSTADGDAATGDFYLHTAENVQNWVTISEINDGELVGSLEATFVLADGFPDNNIFSDTIVVTDCNFRARFIE